MGDFTHFNQQGRARMVDVSEKAETCRIARATARVCLNEATYQMIRENRIKKGDVLSVAQIAGIMGAKNTSHNIPMCHPIMLTNADIEFTMEDESYEIVVVATTKCVGQTGVEMEALNAATIAALTIYDMCKAVQRDIKITDIFLLEKDGGKSGHFISDSEVL